MVLGIGTDILEISRMEKIMVSPAFLRKAYTEKEIELINQKGTKTAAANFCAKEALAKAFGTGVRGFSLRDMEILRNENGAPYVNLYGGAKELAFSMGVTSMKISLSHSREYALACVLLEGE